MTGKAMSGKVIVKEVRFGLFRVVWKLSLEKGKNVKYHQQFLLEGRNFKISTRNTAYSNYVTLKFISCSDHSASQPEDEQSKSKRLKLEEELVLPELKNLSDSVKVMYLGKSSKSEPQTGNDPIKWEFSSSQILSGNKTSMIELWIDFGTNERNEKIVINGLSEILHNQTLCDVKFKFKNSEEIGAHVAILTARSPVFAAMLQSDFVESKTRIVNIADSEMDVFKEMLVYLYTGKAPKLTENNFTQSVYEVADKYGVKSLQDDCVNLLVTQLSNNNAMEVLVWAQFHSLSKLFEKALRFIAKNSEELCSQPAWLDFMKDHPKLWLKINQRMANLIAEGYEVGLFSDEE
ncbi:TD and POZ domain-containing protein 1-like [Daphnia pulicaria]|uniref:TD and POZ domain-containing protein 1-like n=1 Tax=Daphnia pulicaria TaxID=35523 RepID=UPI001EEBE7E9|nr:TD and POZ domain-containing protein 1-like [Daphnia pulicaria]XP_046656713.1 TD and POZ domain-containing protein 1-like [Daphnia pulicaria]XP_046656714.1 TD and POZ domain-containing protein 1-like [Daphnia pulicaria]XP_046656715.1 TD and POZ domain-containing protein 1-like [Daphnia pulicaria]XP_046656716.1 TD and POZ domain-containing protein 1-like [Daphnia pulicaria]